MVADVRNEASEVERAMRAIAPSHIVVGARPIDARNVAALRPSEAKVIATAVASRRREFATGRALLREMTASSGAILVRPDRSPELPPGWLGSLAHDDGIAVAAVTAADADVRALGVDVEPIAPLDLLDVPLVERSDDDRVDPHLLFTMKEAVYKAWSHLGGRMLEHHDVRVSAATANAFTATVLPDGIILDGRWTAAGGRWVALVVVTHQTER